MATTKNSTPEAPSKKIKENDLIGKAVVSMADGAKIATVKDLVFHGLELSALLVSGEHGEGLLPYASLAANGPDAITIESYKLVNWNGGRDLEPESWNTEELGNLSVMDAEGNKLGHIHDLTLSPTGHITEIAVRTEGVFGIGAHETVIPASRIRTVGAEMITVDGAATK